jgi:chromosome segregation ATPase
MEIGLKEAAQGAGAIALIGALASLFNTKFFLGWLDARREVKVMTIKAVQKNCQDEIAKRDERIDGLDASIKQLQKRLEEAIGAGAGASAKVGLLEARVSELEKENKTLHTEVQELRVENVSLKETLNRHGVFQQGK